MGTGVIGQQLSSIPRLAGRFAALATAEIDQCVRDARILFSNEIPKGFAEVRKLDAESLDYATMVGWIRRQGVADEVVKVFWLSDREGYSMMLHDFLDNFDDLWFPSRDDVVVKSASSQFVLTVDHEEQIQLFLPSRDW